jgi:hypothetical protein
MSRSWRLALCVAAAGLVWQPATRGQESPTLDSDPPGSFLSLSGPVTLSGMAPLPMVALPHGEYVLTADGPGLAFARGRLVRSSLGLKGRSWAGSGAWLQPPGLVHVSRGERRGWSFLGAGAVSATMAIRSQVAVRDAEGQADQALAAYDRAVATDEIRSARLRVLETSQEARDQKEIRGLWLGYFALTWLGAATEALLLTPQPNVTAGATDDYIVTAPRAGRMRAAVRSVFVPGAGQRFMGRDGRANIFLTAVAALGAGAITAHDVFLEARRDQAVAQRVFDEAQDEAQLRAAHTRLQKAADRTDDKNALRWALAGATAGVYLWNILDAFGLGHSDGAGELTWSAAPAAGGGFICATWSIR